MGLFGSFILQFQSISIDYIPFSHYDYCAMSFEASGSGRNSGDVDDLIAEGSDADDGLEPPSAQGLQDDQRDPALALGLQSCMELPQVILPDKSLPAHFLLGDTHPLLPNLRNLYETEGLARREVWIELIDTRLKPQTELNNLLWKKAVSLGRAELEASGKIDGSKVIIFARDMWGTGDPLDDKFRWSFESE